MSNYKSYFPYLEKKEKIFQLLIQFCEKYKNELERPEINTDEFQPEFQLEDLSAEAPTTPQPFFESERKTDTNFENSSSESTKSIPTFYQKEQAVEFSNSNVDSKSTQQNKVFIPQEFDSFLQAELDPNLDLKERKNQYIQLLISYIVQLPTQSARKQFALYLLNSPDHFLKTERHFFRCNNYSNQTLSMHKVIASLLKGDSETLLIDDTVNINGHELSRHAGECFA
ncbi:MAG: hypothetical protein H0T84_14235 [Tatlockia sp.]|nr:hypothetical protein [Tatlockia sp.]